MFGLLLSKNQILVFTGKCYLAHDYKAKTRGRLQHKNETSYQLDLLEFAGKECAVPCSTFQNRALSLVESTRRCCRVLELSA